jgi:ADP-heptose:LPS heptosyltransferase
MHVVDRNLSLLEGAGFPVSVRAPDARYILGSKAERPAIPLFRLPERFAVYHPGAESSRKAWGEEGFASLAGRLYDGHGLYPVISWGPGEDGRAMRVAARLPVAAVTPPVDVLALARIVAGASLFVAGDTGPLHLADALGVPTICLFAGTARNPAWRNGPYGGWSADQGAGIESLIDLAVRACREKVRSAGSR